MKLNLKNLTLDLLHLVQDSLWLIAGVSIGAWGAATQPESAEFWRRPDVPGMIATLFVILFVIWLMQWGLDWWWNRKEATA